MKKINHLLPLRIAYCITIEKKAMTQE